jgi:hypothetical protein
MFRGLDRLGLKWAGVWASGYSANPLIRQALSELWVISG